MAYEIKQEKINGKVTPSIRCLECGVTSYHPQDIYYRYCPNCHKFHED